MGGNAFNHIGYTAERMSKEEFHTIEREIFSVLHELNIYGLSIPYVKEKESFGDIDIVIVKEDDRNVKEIICDNIEKFGLREELIFRNKDVISILYKEKYQIDFIFTNRKEKDYHQSYLAYNDLGNLLGRIIKESGFQHGHNGLFYVYREGNHYKELIELTTNYSDALEILGLDVDKFYSGFDTFVEMFEYVTSCKYFKKSRFALENLNNRNRVRDRKRKVYNEFLKYIETVQDKDGEVPSPFDEFPWLQERCEQIRESRMHKNLLREKFNGNNVHKWTGMTGGKSDERAMFGKFMEYVQYQEGFESFLETCTIEELEKYVKKQHENFKKSNIS